MERVAGEDDPRLQRDVLASEPVRKAGPLTGGVCLTKIPLQRSAVVHVSSDARVALVSGLIDHAPLFPPASLELPDALAEDRRARESDAAFALGRLVWPASRLGELPPTERALSVVLDSGFEPRPGVEAAEAGFRDDLGGLAELAGAVYVEVPLDTKLEERLDALSDAGVHAKVRCGGAVVPAAAELAHFLRACRARGLAFKATAGLHHALRTSGEHGFLNLLAAVVFGDEERALTEDGAGALTLDEESFRWRDRAAEAGEIAQARRDRLHSIGSCSFFEPIEELEALGGLP